MGTSLPKGVQGRIIDWRADPSIQVPKMLNLDALRETEPPYRPVALVFPIRTTQGVVIVGKTVSGGAPGVVREDSEATEPSPAYEIGCRGDSSAVCANSRARADALSMKTVKPNGIQ